MVQLCTITHHTSNKLTPSLLLSVSINCFSAFKTAANVSVGNLSAISYIRHQNLFKKILYICVYFVKLFCIFSCCFCVTGRYSCGLVSKLTLLFVFYFSLWFLGLACCSLQRQTSVINFISFCWLRIIKPHLKLFCQLIDLFE